MVVCKQGSGERPRRIKGKIFDKDYLTLPMMSAVDRHTEYDSYD